MIRQSGDVGQRLRVLSAVIIVGVLGAGIGVMSAFTTQPEPGPMRILAHGVIGGVGSALLVYVIVGFIAYLGEAGTVAFTQGTGYDPPKHPSWSPVEAMQLAGNDEGAAAWYEQMMLEWPDNPQLLMRAASFRQSLGEYTEARDLLRKVQRICGNDVAADVQSSYKLMDLFDGPLEEPPRVLSELRRLADRYPNTRIAERAIEAITRRKNDARDAEAETAGDPSSSADASPRQPM